MLLSLSTWVVPLVAAIILHEISHGWVANAFGDPTARRAGRLSLNPVRHVDPVGTLILPVVLAMSGAPIFGWAKPVPVNMARLGNPRWHGILVTAAGPGMNLALALVTAIAYGALLAVTAPGPMSWGTGFLAANLVNFILINLFLAMFNLLPIPPLDGGHIVAGLLPPRQGAWFERLGRFGLPVLLGLLVVLPLVDPRLSVMHHVIVPPVRAMMEWLLDLARLIG